MLGPIRGQLAEDAGCFPRRSQTPIERSRRTPPLGRLSRGSPEELVQSPKTSRCHPGCISPELQVFSSSFSNQLHVCAASQAQESLEAQFCRLPAKAQQAVQSPRHYCPRDATAEREETNRSGATSAPPELGEGVAAKAAQLYCKQLLTEFRQEPPQTDLHTFIRLPKELKEALKVLGRPHAYWPAELCNELRRQALKRCGPEEAALLQKLQQCVKLATDFAFKRGFYEVETDVRRKLWMKDVLAPSIQMRWFDYSNSQIPETKVDIGKGVPPPLLISDASCLDVVERLRSLPLTEKREIFVVTELLDFDVEGSARCGVALQRPHCMTLRADLQRFVHFAAMHMKRSPKRSLQAALCDWKLPQIFVASDVTCIRGSQGDGYPFLERPFQFHVVGMALWTARPRLRTERDYQGERMTMYCDSDDAKAYEVRLELCAHAALLAAGGIELPKEEKPVLVLPVIGLGGSSFHPQDAVVLALKSFRRRFTQFFHSIYICCGDRGPNYSLSDFVESAVNRSAYMMALNDSLAAKALPWHWDQREIQMSIAASKLEKIGHHLRNGPAYVVKIKDDRRSAERKQIVEKAEVHHGFGTLRAYHHRKKLQAADEPIKAQRREGNWPADMVHVKLGGLRDNLELSPEFEDVQMSDLERNRKSLQVKLSVSKVNEELDASQPKSPLSKDLGALQDLMLSLRSSSKTKTFSGWLSKADTVTQQMGAGGQLLLHAKRQSRKDSVTVEEAVASEDVKLVR